MSCTTDSKPTSFDYLRHLKKTWQRGLVIEYVLIAAFVAFTVGQFLFVFGTKAG